MFYRRWVACVAVSQLFRSGGAVEMRFLFRPKRHWTILRVKTYTKQKNGP